MRGHLIFLSAVSMLIVNAIKFEVPAFQDGKYEGKERCVSLFIGPHSLVSGSAEAGPAFHMTTKAKVKDTAENILWSSNDLSSEVKFSFKTQNNPSDYFFCFVNVLAPGYSSNPGLKREITLQVESGPDLFDEGRALDTKIKPLERELIRLESVMSSIVNELENLIKTEHSLRDVNESTSDRVKWFSILIILSLVGLGVWQLFYLKRFFKSKKLI